MEGLEKEIEKVNNDIEKKEKKILMLLKKHGFKRKRKHISKTPTK